MKTNMTHKQMTKHIRSRIAHEGINARVKMSEWCGSSVVVVCVPSYDARFSSKEIETIALIAKVNGMTGPQSSEIVPSHEAVLTEKQQWNFYL